MDTDPIAEAAERILAYAIILNPDLEDGDMLDFVVMDVIDRALIYMNRYQLLPKYLEDLEDTSVEEEDYELPLPVELERVLARVVVQSMETGIESGRRVVKVEDNGQAITYADSSQNSYASRSDADIFGGSLDMLKKYRLATIVEATY